MNVEKAPAHWLEELQQDWVRLQNCVPGASIFQTWHWMKTWWKHFGQGRKAEVFIGREGRDVVGIAPCQITKICGVPRLRWMGAGISDCLGPLVLPGHEEEFAEAVLNQVEVYPLVDLYEIPQDAPLVAAAQRRNWRNFAQVFCPHIPLNEEKNHSFLLKRIGHCLGYEWERAERCLGKIGIETLSGSQLEEGLEALFRLHTKRWNERGLSGEFKDPRVQAFHREWAPLCDQKGWLRLYALKSADRIAAVLYVFHWGKQAYHYMSGFDTAAKRCSPGKILTAHAIRAALEQKCDDFDFLRGVEDYKLKWRPELKPQVSMCRGKGILGKLWYHFMSWRNSK